MSAPERVLADEATLNAVVGAVEARYRALILLLRHTGIRWAEATALRRRRCFVEQGCIEVAEKAVMTPVGIRFRPLGRDYGWVSLGGELRVALTEHLGCFVARERSALVFTDEAGDPLTRASFEESVWNPALESLGIPTEGLGVESLQALRLWECMHEATAQRQELRAASLRGGGAGA